jgi:adenosine kinase
MATVGSDFAPYEAWMDRCGIARDHIRVLDDTYTAQAYITTDQDDNQITAFHPGAMNRSHENRVADAQGVSIGIVSPDGRQGMIEHARQFAEADIPFIFDPGQGMPLFDGEDLLQFVEQASWLAFNDYEARLMEERTGLSPDQLAERVKAVVVTRGGEGSHIYTKSRCFEIPTLPAAELVDPTGCGDAYRAGLLYGLMKGMDWETTGRIAALMGAVKIEYAGTQNHSPSMQQLEDRFHAAFGYRFN